MSSDFDPYREWFGIRDEEGPISLYRLLGVDESEADKSHILAAADARLATLARVGTGDHSGIARALVEEIKHARSVLLDPAKRQAFDAELQDSRTRYYYTRAGVTHGPVSSKKLRKLAAVGDIHPDDTVARHGSNTWRRVAEVEGLLPEPLPFSIEDDEPTPVEVVDSDTPKEIAVRPPVVQLSRPGAFAPEQDDFADITAIAATSPPIRRKQRSSGMGTLISVVLGGVTSIAIFFTPPVQRFFHALQLVLIQEQREAAEAAQKIQQPPQQPRAMPVAKSARRLTFEEVIARTENAVVSLTVANNAGGMMGSGFVVDDSGTCLTSFHVVNGARSIAAVLRDGRTIEAEGFIAAYPDKDIAIIKFKEAFQGIVVEPASPRAGEQVIAIGTPKGYGFSATAGIVSATRRGVNLEGCDPNLLWLQHTAPVSHGNSGGPLLNMHGKVVGINTWVDHAGQNLNFALSSREILPLLNRAKGSPVRPFAEMPGETRPERPRVAETHDGIQEIEPAVPEVPLKVHTPWVLELPTGKRIPQSMFDFGSDRISALFPQDAPKATFNYPDGKVRAMLGFRGRKQHGGAAIFWENGEPHIVSVYEDGKLHGVTQIFDKEGHRRVWQEFKHDHPDGLTCLFRDGVLCYVEECKLGNTESRFLVEFEDGVPTAVSSILKPEQADGAAKELELIEVLMIEQERLARAELTKWGREQSDKRRESLVKEMAPLRRARAFQAIAEQEAAEDAANSSLWKSIMNANVPQGAQFVPRVK